MLAHLKKGFTLMELMVVIAIIGVLSASLFPALTGYLSRARDTKKISEMRQLHTALLAYKTDTGLYYVPGTGWMGGGQGVVNFEDGTTYPKSLFRGLKELGYIAPGIIQEMITSFTAARISTNTAPCNANVASTISKNSYMYYYSVFTGQYSLSAYLENPKQSDIDNIVASYGGIGVNGTCTNYGMNYSVGQN